MEISTLQETSFRVLRIMGSFIFITAGITYKVCGMSLKQFNIDLQRW
jgi:hypothetical protein